MPRRVFEVKGERWSVAPAGRITQYDKDEFSLRFTRLAPAPREERVVRYSPRLAKDRETSLAELRVSDLAELLKVSQPAWTSVELGYRR
jgi:hypothetical protein